MSSTVKGMQYSRGCAVRRRHIIDVDTGVHHTVSMEGEGEGTSLVQIWVCRTDQYGRGTPSVWIPMCSMDLSHNQHDGGCAVQDYKTYKGGGLSSAQLSSAQLRGLLEIVFICENDILRTF